MRRIYDPSFSILLSLLTTPAEKALGKDVVVKDGHQKATGSEEYV